MKKLSVWTRRVPGGDMVVVGQCDTIAEARQIASEYQSRRDLRVQDVEIRLGVHGKRIEFAGPCR